MNFPKNLVGEAQRIPKLQVPIQAAGQKISIVLDTDTYNEVDVLEQVASGYPENKYIILMVSSIVPSQMYIQ